MAIHERFRKEFDPNYKEEDWCFLRAITKANAKTTRFGPLSESEKRVFEKSLVVTKTAMSESSGTIGGYIVPLEYSTALFESIEENSFIRPRATIIPMTSAEIEVPRPYFEVTETAGTTPFFAGMYFSWSTGGTIAETEPEFATVSLKSQSLLGQVVVSNQFLMDIGAAGEQKLIKMFGRAAAWYEEWAFINGKGAGNFQPLGILNSGAAILVNRGTPSQVVTADLSGMAAKLIPLCWNRSIWAVSPSTLKYITALSTFFVNDSGIESTNGYVGTLMTRPVFVTEKLPVLGKTGDVVLFDPSMYCIGHRSDVMIDASTQVLFRNFQTVFRVWLRSDGVPLLANDVTLADGTSTASSIVVLN